MRSHTETSIFQGHGDKPVRWLGTALEDLRAFPAGARQVVGFQLWRLQRELDPNDWKPMPSIGPGVREIRIRTGREFRVIYTTKLAGVVCVLHAFEKRTWKTARKDLQTARRRLSWFAQRRTEVDS